MIVKEGNTILSLAIHALNAMATMQALLIAEQKYLY